MKTSSVKKKSGFCYFYYTSGDKIKKNAGHLLLDIAVTEENPGYWKVDRWSLSDLSKLMVRLKNEADSIFASALSCSELTLATSLSLLSSSLSILFFSLDQGVGLKKIESSFRNPRFILIIH